MILLVTWKIGFSFMLAPAPYILHNKYKIITKKIITIIIIKH